MTSIGGPIAVADIADPRLDDYRSLRDRDLSGARRSEGVFIGETIPILIAMLAQPGLTRSVLSSQRMAGRVEGAIAGACAGASDTAPPPHFVVNDTLLEQTAGFDVHRGVLAVGMRTPLDNRRADAPPFTTGRLLLALDSLNNIDNIGAIFRSAAAFGVDGVLLSRATHDPLYRKVVRVSMGNVLTTPYAWCDDLAATLLRLRELRPDLRVLAADCAGDARDIAEFDVRVSIAPAPHIVIIGNEFEGISPSVLDAATHRVRIPIAAGVDSLNAAVAASIILHRLSSPRG